MDCTGLTEKMPDWLNSKPPVQGGSGRFGDGVSEWDFQGLRRNSLFPRVCSATILDIHLPASPERPSLPTAKVLKGPGRIGPGARPLLDDLILIHCICKHSASKKPRCSVRLSTEGTGSQWWFLWPGEGPHLSGEGSRGPLDKACSLG